jgi:hypothetical protein
MQAQRVTNIIEPQSMSELGEEQANHMTPGREGSHSILPTGGAAQLGNQMRRNIIAKLPQNGKLAGGWFDRLSFINHPCRVAWPKVSSQPFFAFSVGRLCLFYLHALMPIPMDANS